MVGFGGPIAVHAFITPALAAMTLMPPVAIPLVVLGLGMAPGNTAGAFFADRALRRTVTAMPLWNRAMALLFVPAPPHPRAVTGDAFLIGTG